jgi:hypothetical protein
VKITNLGAVEDMAGGGEYATCNSWYDLEAAYDGTVFKNGQAGSVIVGNPRQYWTTVSGHGEFTTDKDGNPSPDESTKTNAHVTNLDFTTNIFRWTVEMDFTYNGNTNTCTATDDVYVTNVTPSVASVGEDREVCEDQTVLSANIPVRGKGAWRATQGNATVGQSCADQHCDAYVTNMSLGPNTFKWIVTNEYRSPKNPDIVQKTCTAEASITLYYHGVKAKASNDQYICSDVVELKGNNPTSVGADGMFPATETDPKKKQPPIGWWSQGSTSAQTFKNAESSHTSAHSGYTAYTDPCAGKTAQQCLAEWHVTVEPLSRSMSTFTWNIQWGECYSSDEVVVYNNLPDPDPDVPADFTTCSNFVELPPTTSPTTRWTLSTAWNGPLRCPP